MSRGTRFLLLGIGAFGLMFGLAPWSEKTYLREWHDAFSIAWAVFLIGCALLPKETP
jgi:hypothetical protein